MKINSKIICFFILFLFFLILIILKAHLLRSLITDIILSITALILFWYTWETSEIRKSNEIIAEANKEMMERANRPIVTYEVYTNKEIPYQTRFKIINLSNYPVAALINCNFKIGEKTVQNFSQDYDGSRYWNLQIGQKKEGHFSFLDIYKLANLISGDAVNGIMSGDANHVKKRNTEYLMIAFNMKDPPELTMNLEIYCKNDKGLETNYTPVKYSYEPFEMVWIPVITSEKPYWIYDKKPSWVSSKEC